MNRVSYDATLVKRLAEQELTVVGDVILDWFTTVRRERPSSEHEGYIWKEVSRDLIPGGAGNTARNAAALGGKVTLIGVVGLGHSAEELRKSLNAIGVGDHGLITDGERDTTVKQRFVNVATGEYAMDVFARETTVPIPESSEFRALETLASTQRGPVVVSDYHRGMITPTLVRRIVEFCRDNGRPLIYDIRPREEFDWSCLSEAFLITPNRREAARLLGERETTNGADSVDACRKLSLMFNTNVLLTRDAQGMTLYIRDSGESFEFPAVATNVRCVSGAGDTVVATIALAISAGIPLPQAVALATHAAGVSVGKNGTAIVEPHELAASIEAYAVA